MVKTVQMTVEGRIELHDQPYPELEEGAVVMKMVYSEVCGTDVHLRNGQLVGVPYPIIPGHVSTGIVEEINGEVTDVEGVLLQEGDPITFLDVHETCNNCWYCLVAKTSTRCPKRKVYGITYSAKEGLLGGWSEYIYLRSGVKIIKLPDKNLMKIFNAAGCGLPTAIHAIHRADIKLGDTVAIQGSGPVGLMVAICAKLSGAFHVILLGAPEQRLKIAEAFYIETLINIMDYDSASRVQEVLRNSGGRGADVTIEATGVPSAVREGMEMTRDGGTYVIVGQYTDAGDVQLNPHRHINKKHLTIHGSWGSDFSHFYQATKLVEKYHSSYPFGTIISREYSLEEAAQALDDVENLRVMKALIKP